MTERIANKPAIVNYIFSNENKKNSVFKTEQFDCKRFVEILSNSRVCFFVQFQEICSHVGGGVTVFCRAGTCQSLLKLFRLTGLKTDFFIKAVQRPRLQIISTKTDDAQAKTAKEADLLILGKGNE